MSFEQVRGLHPKIEAAEKQLVLYCMQNGYINKSPKIDEIALQLRRSPTFSKIFANAVGCRVCALTGRTPGLAKTQYSTDLDYVYKTEGLMFLVGALRQYRLEDTPQVDYVRKLASLVLISSGDNYPMASAQSEAPSTLPASATNNAAREMEAVLQQFNQTLANTTQTMSNEIRNLKQQMEAAERVREQQLSATIRTIQNITNDLGTRVDTLANTNAQNNQYVAAMLQNIYGLSLSTFWTIANFVRTHNTTNAAQGPGQAQPIAPQPPVAAAPSPPSISATDIQRAVADIIQAMRDSTSTSAGQLVTALTQITAAINNGPPTRNEFHFATQNNNSNPQSSQSGPSASSGSAGAGPSFNASPPSASSANPTSSTISTADIASINDTLGVILRKIDSILPTILRDINDAFHDIRNTAPPVGNIGTNVQAVNGSSNTTFNLPPLVIPGTLLTTPIPALTSLAGIQAAGTAAAGAPAGGINFTRNQRSV